jgi:adenylate cyclase
MAGAVSGDDASGVEESHGSGDDGVESGSGPAGGTGAEAGSGAEGRAPETPPAALGYEVPAAWNDDPERAPGASPSAAGPGADSADSAPRRPTPGLAAAAARISARRREDRERAAERGEDLETLLLGGIPHMTAYEVSKTSGIPYDEARRYWRAMGFADVGQARAFTDADVDALMRLGSLSRSGLFTEEFAALVARSMGQTTSRLAEWQIDALYDAFDTAGVGPDEIAELGYRVGRRVLPELEELLVYVWRRQLAAAAGRLRQQLREPDEDKAGKQAVGFADLVSFTRLSRSLSEEELAKLVSVFEANAADTVAFGGGRLIKTLGDEIMFAADSAPRAARIALDLMASMRRTPAVPELRIGVAYGHVVQRNGDVYGTTVNLASRLTVLAEPDTIVVDPDLADALAGDESFDLRPLGQRIIRGLGEVEPSVLSAGS